ncbi:hypothetical protein RFI_20151 [Reticulomyxa filosa]|uniref:Uncharacterized protein n=1 Tax=Reticulomyxa filosa TaxID=46433 RepID=X6MUP4_RETFI|nr:hypothetical protein RFI_20151 [Reticulomyxa filosa]|eukprot:ETO17177.1 hypothetical protein RFI_20151 [Reticulomyxa filosa]
MGTCRSSLAAQEKKVLVVQKKTNGAISLEQAASHQKEKQTKKLLLLGAGESGKSTLFRQMVSLYGKGYSESERRMFKGVIFQNIINAIKMLLRNMDALKSEIETDFEEGHDVIAERTKNLVGNEELTKDIVEDIHTLWNDKGIQKIFQNRYKFQFPDNAPYFFDRMDDIVKPDYIPTQQDLLRSRVRTTSIVETTFEVEGTLFRLLDVGGQRNERKKWIHCFEDVTCIIFVAALSEYDQVLFEDESTSRIAEALKLFNEICNSPWFEKTSIILFLNKKDLFMEKIRQIPLTVCEIFKNYKGPPNDFDNGCEYFRQTFEATNRSHKDMYTHITCATDPSNISNVFNSVKSTLLTQSFREGILFILCSYFIDL